MNIKSLQNFIILTFLIFTSLFSNSFAAPALNNLKKINIFKDKDKISINFETSQIPSYKVFTLENPNRLVVDFENTKLLAKADIKKYPIFESFRSGPRENNGLRVVFNIKGDVKLARSSIFNPGSDSANYRLIVELSDIMFDKSKNSDAKKEAKNSSKENSAKGNKNNIPEGKHYVLTPLNSSIADMIVSKDKNDQIKDDKNDKKSEEKNQEIANEAPKDQDSGSKNLAYIKNKDAKSKKDKKSSKEELNENNNVEKINAKKALKNSKKIIVIDAGHGGKDPGAIGGYIGNKEKNVTLSFAKEIKRYLEKNDKVAVYLTRKGDYFIPLDKRVKISRDLKADLFISIHADSAESNDASGLSIYTLSEKSSDKEAEKLARKENKSDIIGGINFSNASADILKTLIDLSQRSTMNESADFANFAIKRLRENGINVKQNTHRFAGFRVLTSPEVPSVLIELGYLSNKDDEKNLNDLDYHKRFAKIMSEIVQRYFGVYDSEE